MRRYGGHAALGVGFNVQRQDGIVQAHAQQEPSVALRRVKAYPHAFPVIRRQVPLPVSLAFSQDLVQRPLPIGGKVAGMDG